MKLKPRPGFTFVQSVPLLVATISDGSNGFGPILDVYRR
jgi:hypothetical protein